MKYAFLDGKTSCPVRNLHILESGTKDAKAEGLWMLWPVDCKADNKPMGQRMRGLEEDSVPLVLLVDPPKDNRKDSLKFKNQWGTHLTQSKSTPVIRRKGQGYGEN